ncbi:MAG: hypothetical protein ACYCWW_11120, partial [Deltaproteobacteria bacterium]
MLPGARRGLLPPLAFALAACSAPPPAAAPPAVRQGPAVGVTQSFLADFKALAASGRLDALEPILRAALSNGSAADLLASLDVVDQAARAPALASGLLPLLSTRDSGPLAQSLAAGGPLHLLLSDPQIGAVADAVAAVSRTGALHAGVWPALSALLASPLVAAASPGAADALSQGGASAGSYLADLLGLTEQRPDGSSEGVALALADLLVELHAEGRVPGLLRPMTEALRDPAMAGLLPSLSAVLDDLAGNPADLALWDQALDALGTVPPLLTPQTMAALVQLDQAGIDGTLFISNPDGSQRGLNLLGALGVLLGPGGSTFQAGLLALRAQGGSAVAELLPLLAPLASYPYRNGQPVTDGSLGAAPKGLTQLSALIYDGLPAASDTSSLQNLLGNVPGAYTLLSATMGCGTIDPNSPITNVPNYNQSLALQAFDDIVGEPDDLSATKRVTFLACFFGRFNRLSGFLQNPAVSWALSQFGVDINQILNPGVQYVLNNDLDGFYALAAGFDPDFDMSQSGSAALGAHTRFGFLRALYPLLHVGFETPESDPVLNDGSRWFVATAGALYGVSYEDPQGNLTTLPGGQLEEQLLPLVQALTNAPDPFSAAGAPLSQLLWNAQALPVGAGVTETTVGEALAAVLAEATVRHLDPAAPPLFGPALDAASAHVAELAASASALWPAGGLFALDFSAGTPLPLLDIALSGTATDAGLASLLGGPTPLAGGVDELEALLGTPLDRSLAALAQMRQADPQGDVIGLLQRALAGGAAGPLAQTGAAFLRIPGALGLA